MKKMYLFLLFFVSVISFGVRAECPFSIKDASVMLTLPNQTNFKIISSAMCNQKEHFADRFFDADVEIWKNGKVFGKFYSRRVSYDITTLKIILQNTTTLESEASHNKKLKNASFVFIDLKSGKLSTAQGEVLF